ncbi:GTA-gp10 family protein [Methylobacterium oxalidis]|uniref:GTA-gp10 family protein n=1 Tax=Methylobacterium oxalidis TaxID=944322 RepID=UPI003315820B
MSETRITAFLDRDRDFDLLPRLEEMEKIIGAPAGLVVKRVINGDHGALDCPTIVRLALIGAGTSPKEAADLAANYVTARPMSEGHELASQIVLAAWFGVKKPAPVAPEAPGEIILDDGHGNVVRVENGILVPVEGA